MIECSWPLPARRTTSPGRARSNAALMAVARSGVEPLHAARHTGHRFETGPDGVRVELPCLGEGDDREGVVDVEPAGEPELDVAAPAGRHEADPEPPRVLGDVGGMHVGR